MSWKVLITARTLDEVGAKAVELMRKASCELIIPSKYGPHRPETLLPLLPGADAVLASMDKFNAEVVASKEAANLKIISRWGVGYDAIDVAAATAQGIVIGYTPGLLNETVADCAFALLLTLARRIHLGHMSMMQGEWKAAWGNDVFGKTLGLIGC
jgi:lactate dehydrogenase-like 2-hydroxyacid dehydrogenase